MQDVEIITNFGVNFSQYDEQFEPQLGCYIDEPVVLLRNGVKFYKARPVPPTLQKRVENENEK